MMPGAAAQERAAGMRLIVTAGATREWIDPVRFISNPSSGQMGWQIARAGQGTFAEVVFIAGATDPRFHELDGAHCVTAESTLEMQQAVLTQLGDHCLLIMAAAPADYRPAKAENQKIKKEKQEELQIRLVRNPDILLSVAERRNDYRDMIVVGFAAETDQLLAHARSKLQRKQLDFICANQVFKTEQGFSQDHNSLLLISARDTDVQTLGPASKALLAQELLTTILEKIVHIPA